MNQDTIWQAIRYGLLLACGPLVSHGYFTSDDITTAVGAIGVLFTLGWGFYVKFKTKSVPEATAARADVPTVSAATGAVEPATTVQK